MAQKSEFSYLLVDDEVRVDGLLMCKLSKDEKIGKNSDAGSKQIKKKPIECTVKEKFEMRDLWIGRHYWVVNMQELTMGN